MKTIYYFLIFSVIFISCKDDDSNPDPDPNPDAIDVAGLTYGFSPEDFSTTDAGIVSALEAAGPINIVAQVNHSDNATSVGLDLNNTKVIIFGNPNLGTPLMQKNQLTGLDLPQKLFVFQDDVDSIRVAFNNVSYLRARHGLGDIDVLNTIEGALENFATNASEGGLTSISGASIAEGEGIITKISTKNFQETYESLTSAITGNPNLRLVAEVDHQANAASANLELNPTRLVIFGNPNLGTPLMQNAQTTAIDLPQKILVWQDDQDVVHVSYNDPAFIQKRHGITENETTLTTITMALDNLTNAAAGL